VYHHAYNKGFSLARNLANYSGFSYLRIKKRLRLRLLRYARQSPILPLVCGPEREKLDEKRRTAMNRVQGLVVGKTLFAALSVGLIFVGIAQAQIPTFTGKFTLTTQVQWSRTVLQPGDYTVTIESISAPTATLIRDSSGRPVARFISRIDSGKTSTGNALLIREKGEQLRVYALALASLGKVLVYDSVLAHEQIMEARAPQTLPVMLAKR
jgi:hypothetical protein